jgi:zinc protease
MLDRTTPPPFAHSTSFELIQPASLRLNNNIDLFFIRGGEQDVLKIELVLKAGKWFEATPGASYFTAQLLSKGTAGKSSFEIASIFDQYGAHVEIQPGLDFVFVSLYSLTKYFRPVLDLLYEILSEANFPVKELEQHKSIYLQNLKVNNEKTSYLASKAFRKNLFGEQHPYGKENEETEVQQLHREQLTNHFKQYYHDISIFVSGKFDLEIEETIARKFQHWKFLPVTTNQKTIGQPQTGYQYIEKEGSVQSSIRMGRKSIPRSHPDYAHVIFVSHILGGYFGSRLMKNIREEKGLTYGIYASIHPLKFDSYLVIGADVNRENVNLTRDEIHKELKRLRTEKVSADELETAKNHFIGSLQSELTTPFAHSDKIKNIYLFDLPNNYYQQLIGKIDSITADNIIAISEKYFPETDLIEVAVG